MMASHTIKSIKLGSWKVSINTKYLCLGGGGGGGGKTIAKLDERCLISQL